MTQDAGTLLKLAGTTDEEALADVMTIIQRIADTALEGFKSDDEASALCAINNLSRDTIDALAKRTVGQAASQGSAGGEAVIKPIESEFQPVEADYERDALRQRIKQHGPEIVSSILLTYAKGQPPMGSFAGSLWAIGEWVASALSPPVKTGGEAETYEQIKQSYRNMIARSVDAGAREEIDDGSYTDDPRLAAALPKLTAAGEDS